MRPLARIVRDPPHRVGFTDHVHAAAARHDLAFRNNARAGGDAVARIDVAAVALGLRGAAGERQRGEPREDEARIGGEVKWTGSGRRLAKPLTGQPHAHLAPPAHPVRRAHSRKLGAIFLSRS